MRMIRVVLCTAALTLPMAALARAPYTSAGAGDAVLRFSWRMSVTAAEECRPRTAQELEALPVHMRTPEVCTRDQATYALVTRIDDSAPDTLQLFRGGVKGDRPLFILEERALSPGDHRIAVDLYRQRRDAAAEVLASLDTVLRLEPGRVQLITLDGDHGRLVARSSAADPE